MDLVENLTLSDCKCRRKVASSSKTEAFSPEVFEKYSERCHFMKKSGVKAHRVPFLAK